MFTVLKRSLKNRGIAGTIRAVTFGTRCQVAVRGKRGLEIGGPSELFRHAVPVYKVVRSLDNCVFATETIWEGQRENGTRFNFWHSGYGRNRVVDAVELTGIADGEYDFILSCHSLEHIANPVKALHNWRRVAPILLLVLPYCHETFDHLRPVTMLSHMVEDFERDTGEDDLTHVEEAERLSDHSRLILPPGLTLEGVKASVDPLNSRTRCIHHHVFDETNSTELLSFCGYRIIAKQLAASSIFILSLAS